MRMITWHCSQSINDHACIHRALTSNRFAQRTETSNWALLQRFPDTMQSSTRGNRDSNMPNDAREGIRRCLKNWSKGSGCINLKLCSCTRERGMFYANMRCSNCLKLEARECPWSPSWCHPGKGKAFQLHSRAWRWNLFGGAASLWDTSKCAPSSRNSRESCT